MIAWTRVNAIEGSCLDPSVRCGHVTCNRKILWEHSPTRNKNKDIPHLNRGRFNANALPPLIPNQGPLTHGPSTCRPHLPRGAPHGRPHGPAWTRVASCHMSVPCAPHAPRVGHPRPYHVASAPRRIRAVVPRATSACQPVSLAMSAPAGK